METRDNYKGWQVSAQIDSKEVRTNLAEMYLVLVYLIRTEKVKIKNKEKEAEIVRNYIKPLD